MKESNVKVKMRCKKCKKDFLCPVCDDTEIAELEELKIVPGCATATFTNASRDFINVMLSAAHEMLKDAPNYVESVADYEHLEKLPKFNLTVGNKYVFTVQRYYGKTPHDARIEAEEKLAKLAEYIKNGTPSFIALAAFRYAIGRMSMVSLIVTEWLSSVWCGIPKETKKNICDEILDFVKSGITGEDRNLKVWTKFLLDEADDKTWAKEELGKALDHAKKMKKISSFDSIGERDMA